MIKLGLIFIGGGMGSMLRYAFSMWFQVIPGKWFPWPTFLANLVSCLILGIAIKKIAAFHPDEMYWHWLLITGFCGGFSTFSAFSFEVLSLLKMNQYLYAGVYVLASIFSGLLFVLLGMRF